jgi:voltage-gated potassium channel
LRGSVRRREIDEHIDLRGAGQIMRDFRLFFRHLVETILIVRHVFTVFIGLLALCVLAIVQAEGLSVGRATYLVLITALTIGYGDVTPETVVGKIASVAAGILGLLVTGIVIAIAVRALGQAAEEKRAEQEPRD